MPTIKRMPEFDEWLGGIKDTITRLRLGVRLDKAQRGLMGDVKPVGGGVIEMREFFGPGWRMYYVDQNGVLIVMLGGGTKSPKAVTLPRPSRWPKPLKGSDHDFKTSKP